MITETKPLQWLIAEWPENDEIHIVPTDREHGCADCWCGPTAQVVGANTIYVHFAVN